MEIYFNQLPEICDGCKTPQSSVFVCSPMYLDKSICPCSSCILKANCTKVCENLGRKVFNLRNFFRNIDVDYKTKGLYSSFVLIVDFGNDITKYLESCTYGYLFTTKWLTFIRYIEKPNYTMYLYGSDGLKPEGAE